MGYCTYYVNPNGNAVATWVGTGTDAGKSKRVIFLKGSAGARSKTAACDNARSQFCKQYGAGGRCYAITSQVSCVQREGDKIGYALAGKPIPPLCKDLTYGPDPNKGTGGLSTKGGPTEYNQTPAQRKAAICAKNCGWDPICLYDKVKEECGGGPNICSGFPAPFNNCGTLLVAGIGVIVAVLLLRR